MKFGEAREIVGEITEIKPFLTPREDDDPMGVFKIQPVHDKLTEAYFNNDPEDDATVQSFDHMVHFPNQVAAGLLLHCYNKFPDTLNALRSAEELIVDILDNHPEVFPSKGLKVNLTPEQALWRKKIQSCRQDLKKAIADAEEVEVDG